MKFTKVRAPDFDLEKTLDSGQVFHWQKVGDGCVGAIGDLPVYVEQDDEMLKVRFGGPPLRLRSGQATPTCEPRMLPGISVTGYGSFGSQSGNVWPHSFVRR